MNRLTLVVPPGPPARLDVFLARCPSISSRRKARAAIIAGAVTVNGRLIAKGTTVAAGDVIQVADPTHLVSPHLVAEPHLPIGVLYEDEDLVAVDKPPGVPSTAVLSNPLGSVANFLVGRYPEMRSLAATPFEAGLVHRLDTPTSGVLIAARTPRAHDGLKQAFRQATVRKLYLAVVHGRLTHRMTIDLPIAHAPHNARRMIASSPARRPALRGQRAALTLVRPIQPRANSTLVAVRLVTGVRHQIRVHLAVVGYPIIGDRLYAPTEIHNTAPRLLLHAIRVRLDHPTRGGRLVLQARVPAGFKP